ncbi:uncharacterized protein BT62DRAFT_105831 [Guyanagaster necrorhizus]|uniref:BSD domain-containing protein n=1 Tax=Guyanagaster necrorhizus TaxID=856835 RepID=A0A9P8ASB7_9AGAR|nr:uncharacterized protein BT62DRAFT_105831 [Guyanagaster necrorhizus MCA 3950]KAG7446238.1 hypothetical protein BT62DRAFT_105831 [Guyanagaster necrorhizus MCA 3950]
MNFLDPYDLSAAGNSTPPPGQPEQSLNEEVNQVIGQLNRFWGGFRRQTAIETAKKDFSQVVTQAQKELNKYTGAEPSATETESPTEAEPETTPSASTPTNREEPASSSTSSHNIFSRLQSALPPNIVATVQDHIPDSLKHASENIDFVQLRATLSTEFQRIQGVTRSQAEEYVHKSETLLKEAIKEASDVLRDAVKVIPPEDSNGGGLIWDGSDMWMLPADPSETSSSPDKGKGKATSQRAVATRAEALLRRLKHDSEIIRRDPEVDQGSKEVYFQWLASDVSSKEGGIDNEDWKAKIIAALQDPVDGAGLKANEDTLVPLEMTRETFWTRFFFRTHQIAREEKKRQALIRRSMDNEEDFSWEDDDEEEVPGSALKLDALQSSEGTIHPEGKPVVTNTSVPPSRTHTPATMSPRESSEESYDLLSSGNVSETKISGKKAVDSSDDGESDWE